MKIIISSVIILLAIYAGAMSYLYMESFSKNRELTVAFGEAQDLKKRLREEINQKGALQENLQKENERLKKESLSYLEQQKETSDKREYIERLVKKQDETLRGLKRELQGARKELEELKKENIELGDIKNFAGNVEIKKQEERIRRLEQDLSDTRDQMQKQEALLHYNLGVAYTKDKSYDMAIDEYEKALSLNPEDADTHYNLAILYDEVRRNPKRAIQHYQKYLELKPEAEDIDEVRDWIATLMLGETKARAVELKPSPSIDMSRQEKIRGIFLKKLEEIPQR